MYALIRSLLFTLSAEKAHYFALDALQLVLKVPGVKSITKGLFCLEDEQLKRTVAGVTFKNPVGLAAGFDKNAKYIDSLAYLGFGFIEIGTVTPKPQAGNPKPRLFRLPKDQAIINRMGFNNDGLEVVYQRLKNRKSDIVVGGNIGKNKVTPNEEAVNDYVICFERLFDVVDYFVVNVSSPNTPGLRELQEKEPLTQLLNTLQQLNASKAQSKPIFLKIAPDMTTSQIQEVVEVVHETGIAGLITNNTTISRAELTTSKKEVEAIGNGGVSGAPLTSRANEVLKIATEATNKRFPLINVGGIMTSTEGAKRLQKGADLIQLYSGFIYAGPSLIKGILKKVLNH